MGNLENPEIMIQDRGNNLSDESVLLKTFKEHQVNIVEKSCSKKPTNISQDHANSFN